MLLPLPRAHAYRSHTDRVLRRAMLRCAIGRVRRMLFEWGRVAHHARRRNRLVVRMRLRWFPVHLRNALCAWQASGTPRTAAAFMSPAR